MSVPLRTVAILAILSSGVAHGQARAEILPPSPGSVAARPIAARGLAGADRWLLGSLVALNGTDAYLTVRRVTDAGWRETNPVARPFVRSHPGAVAYFAATTLADWWIPREFARRGHRRWARAYLVGGIALEGWAIGNTLSQSQRRVREKSPSRTGVIPPTNWR
jgi:hypothetical protein